jgi:hypothetical protein
MADQGLGEDVLTEYNERSRERQQAYRELQLVCSTELFQWLRENYDPLEYRIRAEFGTPVRWGRPPPSDEVAPLLREYREMLYKTLIDDAARSVRVLPLHFMANSAGVSGTASWSFYACVARGFASEVPGPLRGDRHDEWWTYVAPRVAPCVW